MYNLIVVERIGGVWLGAGGFLDGVEDQWEWLVVAVVGIVCDEVWGVVGVEVMESIWNTWKME